ncbi:MAG: hypothetical protein AAGM67_00360 [Bacteroidota bacterium]
MKTESQIRQKLKQVLYRARKKMLEKRLEKSSCNCKHNRCLTIPDVVFSSHEKIFVCGHTEDGWRDQICDDKVDPSVAKECPLFQYKETSREIKEHFRSQVESKNLMFLSRNCSDALPLLWVLEDDFLFEEESEEEVD